MITLVTGEKNVGKSTYLYEWFRKEPVGCGVISIKEYDNDIHVGYDLLLLPIYTRIQLCTLIPPSYTPHRKDLIQGRFIFKKEAFDTAIDYILENLPPIGEPIWIDEVGILESEGKGFMPIIAKISNLGYDLRIGVRLSCLKKITQMLHNNHCEIIYVTPG